MPVFFFQRLFKNRYDARALGHVKTACIGPATADKLTEIPIWAWHGVDDPVVKFSGSEAIVEAIIAAGGTVKE